jgi:hypothetical protein
MSEPTPERDPKFVLTVADRKAAEAIAAWLTDKGYPAEPQTPNFSAITDGIAGAVPTVPHEFEIWVVKPDDAEKARELIEDQRSAVAALREREARRAARTGIVTAACEECGESSEWPAAEMGTTQDCPHCGCFMDVPDPDENWDDLDVGTEEEAAEKPADGQES